MKRIIVITILSIACSCAWSAVVDVDGTSIKTLAEAVQKAESTDDGPHVINIKVDSLPTPDTGFTISEPVTINGDADNNGKKCDLLVDVKSMQAAPVGEGLLGKAYIKLYSPGTVTINDLQIHPNQNGTSGKESELVDAVRAYCPPKNSDSAQYIFNRVWISGSDGNSGDKFVPLDTAEDLYNRPGIKMWSHQSSLGNRGVIHCANRKRQKESMEKGEYELTLNDCHVGLGQGVGLNFTASSGHHIVNGGIYGHCGLDAIRIAGSSISVTGSPDNRVRLVRASNSKNATSPGSSIVFGSKSETEKVSYVDIIPLPGTIQDIEPILLSSNAKIKENNRLITDPAESELAVIGKPLPESQPFKGWLTPEAAWAEAQKNNQNMILLFYSPSVGLSSDLSKLMETDGSAIRYLSKASIARVDVSKPAGQKIAQQYGVFKIPALLLVAPDAKSYKRLSPDSAKSWRQIEKELSAK